MRKLVLMLILVSMGFVYAQLSDVDYSGSHDDEVNSTTTETIITSDPITIVGLTQTTEDQNKDMDFVVGMGTNLSRNKKVINIPLAYRWRNFGFNATIPYIYEMKVTGVDFLTEETVDVSTSGLGDVFVGTSYANFYEPYNLYYDVNLGVKIPTGDKDAKGEYEGIDYELPLGTDSWDINGGVSLFKFDDNATLRAKLIFIYKGPIENITEVELSDILGDYTQITTETTTQGAQFISDFGFDYSWKYRISFSSGVSFGWNFDGEREVVVKNDYDDAMITDTTIENDPTDVFGMSFADVRQSVNYSISILDFVLGLKVPIYTYSNDDLSVAEIQRNFSVFFKTSYKLF
ncbi:MAG: hypothetical protein KAH33_02310 [Candidatus Delongbacteria bacterium]|nr:hypothetical protein [Candidatus Delongbacteria bacterium]